MKIDSLRAVDGIAFGSSPVALGERGGVVRQQVNAKGETEYWFPDIMFRFSAGKLVEVSFRTPHQLVIDGEVVNADTLLGFMRERDSEYFEALGFGVAPRLGLARDLEHDSSWTSAFVDGRWDAIREANKRMHRTPR